jgi:hypothetical protein
MSSAANVATIIVPPMGANGAASPGTTYPFNVARTSPGSVLSRTYVELEELTTPGVDGRRWRQLRNYFPNFTMETWADYSSYALAVDDCRGYWLAQGQFVTLTWASAGAGVVGVYFQVKVLDVQAQVMAGVLNGFGASATSAAIIHANWTLVVQAVEGLQPQ